MKKTLLNIAVLVLFLFCTIAAVDAQTTPHIVKNALDSTVRLVMKDTNGRPISQGSGFFVSSSHIATNYHVVEGAVRGYAQLFGKRTMYVIEGIARSEERSLAILKVSASSVQPLSLGNSDDVQYGDTVYAVGNPPYSGVRFLKGTMRGRDVESINSMGRGSIIVVGDRVITGPYSGKAEWLQITAHISRGISGGPVLNSKGEIIGVATHRGGSGWRTGNFAVSSKTLMALLGKVKVKPAKPSPQRIPSPDQSSNRIEKTYDVNPGGRLKVDSDIGAIDVQTAARDRVEVVVTKETKSRLDRWGQEALADFKVTFDRKGSNVYIKGTFERGRNYWQRQLNYLKIRFQVTVPRQYNVDLSTLQGNISTDGLAGEVQAQTSAGNIHVDNVVGVVRTHTSAGNLRFGRVRGPILGRSSAGNITLANCLGAVDAKTSAGNIRVDVATQPRREWNLRTSAGNIVGTLGSNVAVDIDAQTSVGNLSTDFRVQGTVTRNRLRGTINGGGPLLKLRTSAGSIRLQRR